MNDVQTWRPRFIISINPRVTTKQTEELKISDNLSGSRQILNVSMSLWSQWGQIRISSK